MNATAEKTAPSLTAELVAYSSVVGRSVMFKNDTGACVALAMVSVPNPQFEYRETADPIAHLIAAAPEVLASLKWMVENDDTNQGDMPLEDHGGRTWDEINSYWIEGLNRARAAIARAEAQS